MHIEYKFCVPQEKLQFIENLTIKSFTSFKHQINITIVLLLCGSFFQFFIPLFLNVSKQTFHISHVRISQNVKVILM